MFKRIVSKLNKRCLPSSHVASNRKISNPEAYSSCVWCLRVDLLISARQSSLWASICVFITPGTCRKSLPNVLSLKEEMQEDPVTAPGTKKCLLISVSEDCFYVLNHGHSLPHQCSFLAMVSQGIHELWT